MTARIISFPYPVDNSCVVHVDFRREEYLLQWVGDWRNPPSLQNFPWVRNASVTPIPHSTRVQTWWTRSQPLNFGADSQIRILDYCVDDFPVCKLAIKDSQRRLIQDEF